MTIINELPQGWQWVKLGDVFKIKSGNFLPSTEAQKDGEYYIYGGNGIIGKHNNFLFEEEKIVIGRVGANCGCVHLTLPKSWITDNALYISHKILDFDNNFMFFCLTNIGLNDFSRSMAQPLISGQIIYPIEIAFPPLTEQQRLANLLTEKLNIIEQAKQAIDAQLKATEDLTAAYLREVFESEEAKTWEWVKLSDVFDITTGKLNSNEADSNGIYPFFTCSREIFRINKYAFDCEAILLAGNNASGDFNVKLYNGKFNAYQRTYIITLKKEYGNNKIIIYYHKLDNYLIELKKQSIGSNTKYLKLPMIENLIVPLPPIEKQKQLADYLTEKLATVEQLKTALKTQREAINQLPAALLKQAFNGKL